ncbi:MAG: cytochrome C, partial [Candidatus Latescibacteria bacterium]|nr:cytochrome C [Candidatus Latescibacterota bacterium]
MIRKLLIAVAALAVAIQFVPYGRDHTNPPVVAEPQWNSPETRETFRRACID